MNQQDYLLVKKYQLQLEKVLVQIIQIHLEQLLVKKLVLN